MPVFRALLRWYVAHPKRALRRVLEHTIRLLHSYLLLVSDPAAQGHMAGERGGGKGSGGEDDKEGASITIEVLQQHFHQPLVQVADELGVSLTVRLILLNVLCVSSVGA